MDRDYIANPIEHYQKERDAAPETTYLVLVKVKAKTGDEAWDTVHGPLQDVRNVQVCGAPRWDQAVLDRSSEEACNLVTHDPNWKPLYQRMTKETQA
jgi:hypothetical protein